MTLKNKNPWKYLSVGLLGVIAIGLIAPIDAVPGNSQGNSSILALLLDGTFGLEAISNDIAAVQSSVDNINSTATEIGKEGHVIIRTLVDPAAGEVITIPVLDSDGVKSYQGRYNIITDTSESGGVEDNLVLVRCHAEDWSIILSEDELFEKTGDFVCKSLEIDVLDKGSGTGVTTIRALVQYTVSENETRNP